MADTQPADLSVEQAPEDVQISAESPAAAPEVPQEIPLEPEVAQEDALPPDGPPVYMKKPPVLLAAVSFAVILLFIIGLAIIFSGRKNGEKAQGTVPTIAPVASSSSSSYRAMASPSAQPATPTPVALKWTAYTSASGSFTMDIPVNMAVKYSTDTAVISFCNIGKEETSIHIFDSEQSKESKLDVTFAQRPANKQSPDDWVLRHCPEVLGPDTEKGIIDEDGVKGVYFIHRFNPDAPDNEPYNLAILRKGGKLSFVYAKARTDLVMAELFDPMFLSFKLLAK